MLAALFNTCLKEPYFLDCQKVLSLAVMFNNVGETSESKMPSGKSSSCDK